MPLVIAGATSGSTTVQATDAVTATITLPSATGTVQLSGAAVTATNINVAVGGAVLSQDIVTITGGGSSGNFKGLVVKSYTGDEIFAVNNLSYNVSMGAVAGNLKTGSTISVGNATPSTSGAGITFPATQSASTDANTLDDYEEGTWTPVFEGTTGSIGATASTVSGTYTKIGRQVTCYGEIVLTNKGSWTGGVRIAGKPFNSASTYVNVGSLTMSNVSYTAGASLAVYMNTGATGFYMDTSVSGGARTVVSVANVANNSEFYFTFTYTTS